MLGNTILGQKIVIAENAPPRVTQDNKESDRSLQAQNATSKTNNIDTCNDPDTAAPYHVCMGIPPAAVVLLRVRQTRFPFFLEMYLTINRSNPKYMFCEIRRWAAMFANGALNGIVVASLAITYGRAHYCRVPASQQIPTVTCCSQLYIGKHVITADPNVPGDNLTAKVMRAIDILKENMLNGTSLTFPERQSAVDAENSNKRVQEELHLVPVEDMSEQMWVSILLMQYQSAHCSPGETLNPKP